MNKKILIKEIQEKCLEYLREIETTERNKKISKELTLSSINIKLKKYLNPSSNMYYLEDDTNQFERENIIKVLSLCGCCDEHKRHRPGLSEYNSGFMPEYPNPSIPWQLDTLKKIGKKNCDCYCRFVCRYICRIDNDEILF